ncbi:hypothetical protein TDB9533_04632 [Thalassocella blandensis]|nr:hypothetical protein TDB9533_04632 [Thalassocella blandensis]
MQFLLKPCQECQKPLNGGVYRYRNVLVCPHCDSQQDDGKSKKGSKRPPARARVVAPAASPDSSASQPKTTRKTAQKNPKQQPVNASAQKISTNKISAKIKTQPAANQIKPADVKLIGKVSADDAALSARLGEVNSESQASFKKTAQMFANGKFVGSKVEAFQESYNLAKKDALQQLRREAVLVNANTVADISIKYSVKSIDATNAQVLVKVTGTALSMKTVKSKASA